MPFRCAQQLRSLLGVPLREALVIEYCDAQEWEPMGASLLLRVESGAKLWLRWSADEQAVWISADEPVVAAYTRVLPLRVFMKMDSELGIVSTIEAYVDEDTSGLFGVTLDPDGAGIHVCMSAEGLSQVCRASDAEMVPGVRRVTLCDS